MSCDLILKHTSKSINNNTSILNSGRVLMFWSQVICGSRDLMSTFKNIQRLNCWVKLSLFVTPSGKNVRDQILQKHIITPTSYRSRLTSDQPAAQHVTFWGPLRWRSVVSKEHSINRQLMKPINVNGSKKVKSQSKLWSKKKEYNREAIVSVHHGFLFLKRRNWCHRGQRGFSSLRFNPAPCY